MATARSPRRPPRGAGVSARPASPPGPPSPADFEKLGAFYLGRPWDVETGTARAGVVLYDSRDLVTHAVCVGMTGSGKTGLCLALLEEAALDGVPAIVIDPKGDLGNLLLTFPALAPEDFRPWINEDDAHRQGLDPEAFARAEAERWAKGLAAWGQDGARIARLRAAADFAIYTPGSTAGLPVSVLASFAAPPPAVRADAEALAERAGVAAASLLGLLGIDADPIRSREHILLSRILHGAWSEGRDLDLAGLIHAIQSPGIERVGVLDLEAFYPARERFELAMALNNLLAAPGFEAFISGEPLDPARLLYTEDGRPRVSIVSIAHLSDRERMFVVALLLNQVTAWMRAQSGTTSLRAILYMDEIFGYFPPVANPPSKAPLLTLLKQARAYGLGVVLATQNPVDLDYKGLANTGTWFIGRLQTERDRARVLDGLDGVAGGRVDRRTLDAMLAGLASRVFLMHDVHEDAPQVFETRWVMSYLRGPLTRAQIRTLMAARAIAPPSSLSAPAVAPAPAAPAAVPAAPAREATAAASPSSAGARPLLPPEIPQHVLPRRTPRPPGATLMYRPMLLGAARVRYADARRQVDAAEELVVVTPIADDALAVDWDRAEDAGITTSDLEVEPEAGAAFAPLPAEATRPRSYDAWRRDFVAWVVRARPLALLHSPSLGLVSRPGETEGDFRIRVRDAAHEKRDALNDRLRKKYAPKIAALQERIRRAEQAVARESAQATQSQVQVAVSIGATLLGAFLGRRAASVSTLGRATTAARGVGRAMKEREDIGRARQTLEALREQLAALEAEFRAEVDALPLPGADEPLDPLMIRASRTAVDVRVVALAWAPWWEAPGAAPVPAWR